MKKIIILGLSAFACLLQAEDLLINQTTYFKKSTAQSSSLPSSDKCEVADNSLVSANSISSVNGHYKVTLQNHTANCSFASGYFYQPHVDRESHLVTVTHHSVFKKKRVSSTQLPNSDKCDIAPGVYAATMPVGSVDGGHYYLKLKKMLSECAFSQGYLWEGHTKKGSLAVQITSSTYFKKTPKQSSELPSSDKCYMGEGLYALGANAVASAPTHYQITLAQNLANCSFKSGYVFYDHTQWKKPYVPPAKPQFTFPLPGGYYTSGWCKCRNIGTSPHIGQDISKGGTKKAVAVQNGKLTSTTYSSSCGYISYLKDDWGANWRYVHLNRPSVSAGSRVSPGQHLAYISQYPKSGCGSGAHLHFERRSAGYFKDSPASKSCQNGKQSCYYDPIKPWRSSYNAKSIQTLSVDDNINWMQDTSQSTAMCKVELEQLNPVKSSRFEAYPINTDDNLMVDIQFKSRDAAADVINANVFLKGNQNNLCKGQRCVTQWQLVSESIDGKLTNIFFHNRVRNIPLVREAEEMFCVPQNQSRYWLLLKDNSGKQCRTEIHR